MTELLGIDEYEIKSWLPKLGSIPIERVAYKDMSESYEMERAHVFRLENGQFALVTESGCSCYDYEDAVIDLFPDLKSAMESFDKWVKRNRYD